MFFRLFHQAFAALARGAGEPLDLRICDAIATGSGQPLFGHV